MNGKPDTLKGSYYANVGTGCANTKINDRLRKEFPQYYGNNICKHRLNTPMEALDWHFARKGPDSSEAGVEGFKDAFTNLGQ